MEKLLIIFTSIRAKQSRGFTLLEYCAGAAIICGVVWLALTAFGTGVSGFLGAVTTWLGARGAGISG